MDEKGVKEKIWLLPMISLRQRTKKFTGGNKMKKAVVMLLVVALFAGILGFTPVRAAESTVVQMTIGNTKATINFKGVVLDQPPVIESDRTLVPVRFIGEALGAKIGWDPVKRTVSYVLGTKSVVLTIGSTTVTVNGVKSSIDVAPKILGAGRTVVPVRFVSEVLGAKVDWNSSTRVVTVTVSATFPESLETIKIGVGSPLTGNSATEGGCVLRGAEQAVKDVNAAGGINGQQVELVIKDNHGDPKDAATIASLFVQDKGVIAVIEGPNSTLCLAGTPIYNNGHLVDMNVGASSPKVSAAGPYTFRVWANDTYRVAFDVQILLDEGYTKVGVIYQNDDFGLGGLPVLEALMAKKGLKPLVVEAYLGGGETKDFSTVITKMRSAGCDSVFAFSYEPELALFCKQAVAQGWTPFIASTGAYRPHLIMLGGDSVNGVVGDAFYNPEKTPDNIAALFAKLNVGHTYSGATVLPNNYSPCSYDATNMILEAIKSGAKTREDVKEFMTSLKDYPGMVGTLSFDENGDVAIPLVRIEIKGGKYVMYHKG
jgi:branched-chain amino acid transport system substrate-binding protein